MTYANPSPWKKSLAKVPRQSCWWHLAVKKTRKSGLILFDVYLMLSDFHLNLSDVYLTLSDFDLFQGFFPNFAQVKTVRSSDE